MQNIIKKLFAYIENEDIIGLARYCLILLPFVGGAILATTFLFRYVTDHKETLILIGVAACMIIPPFLGKKEDKPETKSVAVNDNTTFFERLLIKALFQIFTSYSQQFQVIAPLRYSDLNDMLPSGIVPGKSIVMYRFKVMSDGTAISMPDFHEFLTIHIEELLASDELALGKPTAEFFGKLYPKVYIDECACAGGVWHIALLVCDNENVAQYIDNKRQALIMRTSCITAQYGDSDF